MLRFVVALFGLITAFLIVEVGLRLMKSAVPAMSPNDRPSFYYLPSSAESFRDRRYPFEKPVGTFRIAVVGDSFSFGPDLQFDDTFAKRLERMFQLNPQNSHVEVLNFGTPGAGTAAEVELTNKALAFHPDLILLQVTLNDPQERPIQDEPPEVRAQFGPYQPSSGLMQFLDYSRLIHMIASLLHNTRSVSAYINYHKNLFDDERLYATFGSNVTRIKNIAQGSGAKFSVCIMPLFDFPLDAGYPFAAVHQKLRTFFEQQEIPTLDLLDSFLGMDHKRLQTRPGEDSHPNEIAHRIVAEALYKWLYQRELVPPQDFDGLFARRRDNVKDKYLKLEQALEAAPARRSQHQKSGGAAAGPHGS